MRSTGFNRAYDRMSHVMVVDDDQTLLKFFKIHLNKFFSKVVVVKSAKEAVETLKEKEIDLILTDIRMPKVDGVQLLKKIRAYDASIPVFMLSGGALTAEQIKTVDESSDGFLKKPFTIDEIQEFIELGMRKRELLKQLSELVPDNKKLLAILKGKAKLTSSMPSDSRAAASELLVQLAG